jgi:UrcA family protein
MKSILFGVATLAALACASASDATSSRVSADSVAVSYSDLNLNTANGAETLYGRLDAAAKTVCGRNDDLRNLERQAQVNACRAEALGNAVEKVDARLLTAIYNARASKIELAALDDTAAPR